MVLTRSARKAALTDVTNANEDSDEYMATPRPHANVRRTLDTGVTPQSTVSRVLVGEMARLGLATPCNTVGNEASAAEQQIDCVMPQKLEFGPSGSYTSPNTEPIAVAHTNSAAAGVAASSSNRVDASFHQLASPSVAHNLELVQKQSKQDRLTAQHDDIMSLLGAGFTKAPAYVPMEGAASQANGGLEMTNPCTPEPQATVANFRVVGHEISKQWKGQHVVFDLLGLSKVKVVAERVAFNEVTCNTGSSSESESTIPGQGIGCSPARIKRAVLSTPVQALAFEDDEELQPMRESADEVQTNPTSQTKASAEWCGTHIVYTDEDTSEDLGENRTDKAVEEIKDDIANMHIARKVSAQRRNPRAKPARSFAWL
ncbi:hypothetical protein FVE85_5882 [Porphyridium purpureum]|uniref:Uncharacterized protein n=1 Tax=Porphyridium purpureum TaxID=35688 RepID=A0A5J4Z6L7_PORPP|nr:hypothetical protein FVE85_5882 [Porphyridium purpureum]|eukprot:POR0892..scf295_1